MDELVFLGALFLMLVAGLLLVRVFSKKDTDRKTDRRDHLQPAGRKPSHRPASHTLVHSHASTGRMHVADDIWRDHRPKVNEAHWHNGVTTANRLFTDAELAREEQDPELGHGMTRVEYKPVIQPGTSASAAGNASNKR